MHLGSPLNHPIRSCFPRGLDVEMLPVALADLSRAPFTSQGSYSPFPIKWSLLSVTHLILTTALCSILGWCYYSPLQMGKLKLTEVKWLGQSPKKHWMDTLPVCLDFFSQVPFLSTAIFGVKQEWYVINWLRKAPWAIDSLSFCVGLQQPLSDQRKRLCGQNWWKGIH